MPDLFDNIFTRIGTAVNGKSRQHYLGASQVNTGRFYSYHENGTNNNYWLPTAKSFDKTMDNVESMNKGRSERMNSVNSMSSEEAGSRKNSVVSMGEK